MALALALAAWAPLPGTSRSGAEDRDWNWSGRVDRGDAIEIKGVNGEISAELARGNEVGVEARLHGRRDDPDEIEMVVLEHANGVTICAVYPSDDPDEPNECRPGSRGRMNVNENDVSVDFVVRVPAGVNLIARTVNGDVEAFGLEGEVKAHTVNGGIDVTTSVLAQATTVNGSITVSMGRSDWEGTLDFTTVNGSVTLEFPGDLDCDVSVSTVNGHISSDYPLTVHGRFSPRQVRGTIGDGGRQLVVKTVNGSVQIRRS
jgi:DUF4097 and DUF4098 domain-containing protein YvlB